MFVVTRRQRKAMFKLKMNGDSIKEVIVQVKQLWPQTQWNASTQKWRKSLAISHCCQTDFCLISHCVILSFSATKLSKFLAETQFSFDDSLSDSVLSIWSFFSAIKILASQQSNRLAETQCLCYHQSFSFSALSQFKIWDFQPFSCISNLSFSAIDQWSHWLRAETQFLFHISWIVSVLSNSID